MDARLTLNARVKENPAVKLKPLVLGLFVVSASTTLAPAANGKTFVESISSGKVSANFRTRFESVDDNAFRREAEALTLRSRLGYETAPISGFTALLEFEDVHALGGMDHYQLPAPPTPAANGYPVVADAEGTEINRVQLRYRGISRLDAVLGRQRLMLDNQRFIGAVAFRQDEQTYDALSGVYTGVRDVAVTYAYVDKVNGITPVFDANVNDRLFNISYNGFLVGKLIAYHYALENQEEILTDLNPGLRYDSNETSGVRFDGFYVLPTTVPLRAIYRAEAAEQDVELRDNKSYSTDYRAGELGVTWTFGGGAYALTPLLGNEILGADDSKRAAVTSDTGLYAFQTPYATKHVFNGWVDQFLVTPNQGLDDRYVSVGFDLNNYGIKTLMMYHEYVSDVRSARLSDEIDLGDEINIQVMKNFGATWIIGAKYGKYNEAASADRAVSGRRDADKFWVWAELNF